MLFMMKAFHSLVIHRVVRRAWKLATKMSEAGADANMVEGGGVTASGEHEETATVGGKRIVALLLQSLALSAHDHIAQHGESFFSSHHLDLIFNSPKSHHLLPNKNRPARRAATIIQRLESMF